MELSNQFILCPYCDETPIPITNFNENEPCNKCMHNHMELYALGDIEKQAVLGLLLLKEYPNV